MEAYFISISIVNVDFALNSYLKSVQCACFALTSLDYVTETTLTDTLTGFLFLLQPGIQLVYITGD